MDGILIIDKPEGMTSHDVVSRVRRVLGTKRVGHTGTLDPFATGVLVALVGKATRLAQFLDKDEKEYEALIRFGFETDTGDRTGQRIDRDESSIDADVDQFSMADWEQVLSKFRGDIMQTPPMYSAKKIAGKKLYEHARLGVEVERKPVAITISELEVLDASTAELLVRVVCSAGTYIRTLAEDIGRAAGTRAHVGELRRTRAGRFTLDQATALQDLDGEPVLVSMDQAIGHLPEMLLSAERAARALDGLATRVDAEHLADRAAVRMLDPNGGLIAIGIYDEREKSVKPKIVLR